MANNNDGMPGRGITRPHADDPCRVCGNRFGEHMADRKEGERHYCPKTDASPTHAWPWRDTVFVSNVYRPHGRDPKACPACSHGALTSDLCNECGVGYLFAIEQAVEWLRECERAEPDDRVMRAHHIAADMLEDGTAFLGGFRVVPA